MRLLLSLAVLLATIVACSRTKSNNVAGLAEQALDLDHDETIGSDANTSGNVWGRGVSRKFQHAQLQQLYDTLNSAQMNQQISALNCGKQLPKHEFSVTLWWENSSRERQVRLQMTPRLYKDDSCLEGVVDYLFQRTVKLLDPGPPIDYGYRSPLTGEHLDTSRFANELPEKPDCSCRR